MRVHVRFPPPGFFLNSPRLVVRLADRKLYDGGFTDGFDVSVGVDEGDHVIETSIYGPLGVARMQQISLSLSERGGYRDVDAVEVELRYSRLTGNFRPEAKVSVKR